MDIRTTPHLNRHLQESVRPMCEKLRSVLYEGKASIGLHVEFLTALATFPDQNAVLVDGRAAEGVRTLTVGEAATACQFLVEMLEWSQAPENFDRVTTALKFCVRPMRAE